MFPDNDGRFRIIGKMEGPDGNTKEMEDPDGNKIKEIFKWLIRGSPREKGYKYPIISPRKPFSLLSSSEDLCR
jgi:hypothetical protein